MICLRCGYCCKKYAVIIVDDPSQGIIDSNLKEHLGDGPCQHLQGEIPGEYSCKIHEYDFYKDTPCYQYGQIESDPNTECRLGRHLLDKYAEDNIHSERST